MRTPVGVAIEALRTFTFYVLLIYVVCRHRYDGRFAPNGSDSLDSLSSTLNARLRFQPAPKSAFEVMPLLLGAW